MDTYYIVEAEKPQGTVLSLTGALFGHGEPIQYEDADEAFAALGRWRARMTSPSLGKWDTRVIRVESAPIRTEVDPRNG